MNRLYSDLASVYDDILKNKNFNREAEFVLRQIVSKDNYPDILELGCGTGCHLLALTSLGCTVIGIDKSRDMLTQAIKKCPTSKMVECDFESEWPADIGTSFDAVVCLGSTIAYVIGVKAISSLFSQVERLLKPNGVFIFDLWKTAGCKAGSDFEKIIIKRNEYEIIRAAEWTPKGDLLISKDCFIIQAQNNTSPQVVFDTHKLFLFDTSNLKQLLKQRGWRVAIYSDFTKQPFNGGEQRAVFVATWPSTNGAC